MAKPLQEELEFMLGRTADTSELDKGREACLGHDLPSENGMR